MVLADAHLGQDDPEPACETAERAIVDGDHIRSARCVHYVREFRGRLVRFTGSPTVTDFAERVAERRLWRMAAS